MIASARTIRTREERFLEMLPQIRAQARYAFRKELPARRQELIAEVIANCWIAFVRLLDRGLEDVIYPTPLAQYAIRQTRDGRKVGGRLNVRDVSSEYAQRCKGFRLERLDRYNERTDEWKEVLVEDKTAGPAEIAVSRIDFGTWLRSLPVAKRQVARALALGETTKRTARRFRVTAGRVSQLRRELQNSWESFQGEPAYA